MQQAPRVSIVSVTLPRTIQLKLNGADPLLKDPAVRRALDDPNNESPKPGDPIFANSEYRIIARPADGIAAAEAAAKAQGFECVQLGDRLEGEAREVAAAHARLARDLQAQGKSVVESALAAAHLRFRPIVMTSLAFILGVVPLAIASGASSASQRAIGTGVISGMVVGTFLAVFFVPIFFVVVRSLFKGSARQRQFDAQHSHQADTGNTHA